jgi:hypothetical protein
MIFDAEPVRCFVSSFYSEIYPEGPTARTMTWYLNRPKVTRFPGVHGGDRLSNW